MKRAGAAFVVGALAWSGGCSASSREGVTVSIEIEAPASPAVTAGTRAFETDRASHVTLTRGYLSLGSVELLACPGATAGARWRGGLRLGEAHAHVVGSPTLLGVPRVASLLEEVGARTRMGVLRPPAGAYCRIKQTILAADADAPGLPADGVMLGKSLVVEGTRSPSPAPSPPDEAPRAFRFTSTASFDVEATIEETALAQGERRVATVVLVTSGDRWFDGVDFEGDERDAVTRILSNIRASLGARVE